MKVKQFIIKYSHTICFFAVIALAIITTIVVAFISKPTQPIFKNTGRDFGEGWQCVYADGTEHEASFPEYTKVKNGVILSNTIPEDVLSGELLYIRTNRSPVSVKIDGEEVEVKGVFYDRAFSSDYVGAWLTVNLSYVMRGKSVEIIVDGRGTSTEVVIYGISITTGAELLKAEVASDFGIIIVFCVMIMLALLMFVLNLIVASIYKTHGFWNIFYLTVFIILASFWILSDSNVLVVALGYNDVFYFASYLSFMLLPTAFTLYLREEVTFGKSVLKYISLLNAATVAVVVALSLGGAITLPQGLSVIHIFLALTVVADIVVCALDGRRKKHKHISEALTGILTLALFSLAALIDFYIEGYGRYNVIFSAGMVFFIIILSVGNFKKLILTIIKARSVEGIASDIPSGIFKYRFDDKLTIIYANDAYYKMFGYTRAEAETVGFDNLCFVLHPFERKRVKDCVKLAIDGGEDTFELESQQVHKLGRLIYVYSVSRLNRETGEITAAIFDISQRKAVEEQLRVNQEEYKIAVKHSNKTILRYDLKTRDLIFGEEASKALHVNSIMRGAPESLLSSGVVEKGSIAAVRAFFDAMIAGEDEGHCSFSIALDRGVTWFGADYTLIRDSKRKPIRAVISCEDITLAREKEAAYEKWRQSVDSIDEADFVLYECNVSGNTIEYSEGELIASDDGDDNVMSSRIDKFVNQYVVPDERKKVRRVLDPETIARDYKRGERSHSLDFRITVGGKPLWVNLSVQSVEYRDANEIKAFILIKNINDSKVSEILTLTRSMTDPLTGVYNRIEFVERFNRAVERAEADGINSHAFVMLDVDNFKTINDSLGHIFGDAVLTDVSHKLNSLLDKADLLGRIGGDEFILYFNDVSDFEILAERLDSLCKALHFSPERHLTVSVSVGAVLFGAEGSFNDLYKKSDAALYQAKNKGKNGFVVYEEK